MKRKTGGPPVYQYGSVEHSIDPCSNSLDNTFKYKFVRITSEISGLAEVESAKFFLSPLIANPLISPQNQSANPLIFFLVRY